MSLIVNGIGLAAARREWKAAEEFTEIAWVVRLFAQLLRCELVCATQGNWYSRKVISMFEECYQIPDRKAGSNRERLIARFSFADGYERKAKQRRPEEQEVA